MFHRREARGWSNRSRCEQETGQIEDLGILQKFMHIWNGQHFEIYAPERLSWSFSFVLLEKRYFFARVKQSYLVIIDLDVVPAIFEVSCSSSFAGLDWSV